MKHLLSDSVFEVIVSCRHLPFIKSQHRSFIKLNGLLKHYSISRIQYIAMSRRPTAWQFYAVLLGSLEANWSDLASCSAKPKQDSSLL